MQMHEGRGYVVYPNSVFRIEGTHFTYAGIITDPKLENCRQFFGINAGKAYVSCWGSAENPTVAVLDLNSSVNQRSGLFQFAVTDQVKKIPLNTPVNRHAIDRIMINPRTQVLYASTPPQCRSKGYVLRYKLPAGVTTTPIAVTDSIPPISPVVGFALQP